ncbi:MAG: helix-turn-helix domain-containing protein [Saprospiraceae bacterium]
MKPSHPEMISDTLQILRRYHGFPQKYLAVRLGVSQTAYSKMERGLTRVAGGHLDRVAQMYGLLPAELESKTGDEIIQNIIARKPQA